MQKYGRPNEATPAKWHKDYKDFNAPLEASNGTSLPPAGDSAPTAAGTKPSLEVDIATKNEPDTTAGAPPTTEVKLENGDGDSKKRKRHENETSEEKAERKKKKREKKEKKEKRKGKKDEAGDEESE